LLGDIPILGYLFKKTSKKFEKTNLLIVLTPYVIRDQSDLRRIFNQKLEERREFIERYTAFKNEDIAHDIDYRHKRGLLSEISKVSLQVQQETQMLEEANSKIKGVLEPVDMPKGMTPSEGGGPPSGMETISPSPMGDRPPPPDYGSDRSNRYPSPRPIE
jgi:general secretion pathway protein D